MLKEPAMGDTPAPASKPKDSSASASAPLPESQTTLNRAMSTAPPTDDIDSEWPSDDEPLPEPRVESAAQAVVAVSSASEGRASDEPPTWREADEGANALMAPRFPSDPGLPRDLRSPSSVPSSRPAVAAEAAPLSKRDMDTVPAAPQASRPPNSTGPNSSRRLANADAAEAMAVSARLRASQTITEAAPPSVPVAAPAVARFESSPAPVVALPSHGPESRREPSADSRHSFDPHVHLSQPVEAKKPSRAPLLFALVASAAAALLLMRAGGGSSTTSPAHSAEPAAVAVAKPEPAKAEPAPQPTNATPAKAEPAPQPTNAEPAKLEPPSTPKPADVAAEPPKAAGEAASAPSAASAGNISVLIRVKPPQARIFYRGKEVGKAPVTVEIEPGKRRAYEVSLPGFMTRKVVVDGSETELSVGLRPDPTAAAVK